MKEVWTNGMEEFMKKWDGFGINDIGWGPLLLYIVSCAMETVERIGNECNFFLPQTSWNDWK